MMMVVMMGQIRAAAQNKRPFLYQTESPEISPPPLYNAS